MVVLRLRLVSSSRNCLFHMQRLTVFIYGTLGLAVFRSFTMYVAGVKTVLSVNGNLQPDWTESGPALRVLSVSKG